MDGTKAHTSSPDKKRKKLVVSTVGGIAGIFILGGAFAVAALLRNKPIINKNTSKESTPTFTKYKSDNNNNNNHNSSSSSSSNRQENEGLRTLLQSSESPHCCRSNIQCNTSRVTSTDRIEALMEERSHIEVNAQKQTSNCVDQEIETENSEPEITPGISSLDTDQGLLVYDTPKSKYITTSPSRAAVTMMGEGDLPDSARIADFLYRGDAPLLTANVAAYEEEEEEEEEQEEEEEEEEEEVSKTDKDSDDTVDSSIESNSEIIWPAETIEEELVILKDRARVRMNNNDIDFDDGSMTKNIKQTRVELIHPPSLISSRPVQGICLWLFLAVGLLYLFFYNHLPKILLF